VPAAGSTVAFVTHAALPRLSADDQLAVEELTRRRMSVAAAVWDDRDVDWRAFDLVVIRSTWDYAQRSDEFLEWLGVLEGTGARVWNPPRLMRWNLDKRYLRDLAAAGVETPPTRWLERGSSVALPGLLEQCGWEQAVVKPVVSADGVGAWTTSPGTAARDQYRLERALSARALMVQRYLPEVTREGEWSLIFIDGEFSHTVLKMPATGDFRVQERYGGSTTAACADADLLAVARAALAIVPTAWLYARVDIVRSGPSCTVMELELIEPSLFFVANPERAPGLLAAAIAKYCRP
jgi:glutathione synthase/RimK-type ligase-like ATP-grasp enzyme